MNKESLEEIKALLNKINEAKYYEQVEFEIGDLMEFVPKLIQAYEDILYTK